MFDESAQAWKSPAGLIYGFGSKHGNRIKHILQHLVENPNKPIHSVFSVSRSNLYPLLDDAWKMRKSHIIHPTSNNWNYVVDLGRTIGTKGESKVLISVKPLTSEVITAHPTF